MNGKLKNSFAALSPTKKNLLVDSVIFLLVLFVDSPHFTGQSLHEWLGLAFGAGILTHLLLHWQWIVATTQRFFAKTSRQARINYALNLLLFIDITLVTMSGLLISRVVLPFVGIFPAESGFWRMLHTTSADFFVILVGVHVALHWSWIVKSVSTYVVQPVVRPLTALAWGKQAAAAKKEFSA